MAFNQNSLATAAELILGNCKIESALTVGATFVNLGNGAVTAAGHNIIPYDAQSQNGPRPLTGIADETFTVVGEMMEYEGSTLAAIHGGSVTETNTTTLSTIIGGGNTVITRRAFKITNTSMYGGSTVETIMIIPNAKMDNVFQMQKWITE